MSPHGRRRQQLRIADRWHHRLRQSHARATPTCSIAGWTDEQVKTAIRTGNRPDRPLVRLMAFDWYKTMSDEDLDDLVAFLRTLKPVKTE